MPSRKILIIGFVSLVFGVALVALWVVNAALNMNDPPLHLSVFEPHAGGCAWYEQGPTEADGEVEITRFSVDCARVQAAWSLDSAKALVWFPDEELGTQDEPLFLVDVKNRKAQRLRGAEPGEPVAYAIDAEENVLAFTENQQISVLQESAEIEFQGKRLPLSTFPDGQDVAVHALHLSGGAWQAEETKASRCCAEGAPGIGALNRYESYRLDQRLAPRQTARILTEAKTYAEIPKTSDLVDKAKKKLQLAGDGDDAPWLTLQSPQWKKGVLFRGTRSGVRHPTGVAVFTEGNAAQRIPGFTYRAGDVLQFSVQGRYLLITEWGSGMQPHLYDMQTGQLLYSSSVAVGVTFWPSPWTPSPAGVP